MNENNIIAGLLTVAYSMPLRDAVDPETVVHTYDTFRKLLQEREEKEPESKLSIPEALKPLVDQALSMKRARQKQSSTS